MRTGTERRKLRVRSKVKRGGMLRLSVHRTCKYIYAQIIDDAAGKTLAAASSLQKDVRDGLKSASNMEAAKKVGAVLAERAKKAKIKQVVFDRGGYRYHGRVKALADAARENGLKL